MIWDLRTCFQRDVSMIWDCDLRVTDVADVDSERQHYEFGVADVADVVLERYHCDLRVTDVADVVLERQDCEFGVADVADVDLERYHCGLRVTDVADVVLERQHYEFGVADVTDVLYLRWHHLLGVTDVTDMDFERSVMIWRGTVVEHTDQLSEWNTVIHLQCHQNKKCGTQGSWAIAEAAKQRPMR